MSTSPQRQQGRVALRSPILNRDARNGGKVAVFGHDDAIRKCACNGANLHVDLLDYSACPLERVEDPSVFLGGFIAVRPDEQARHCMLQKFQIPVVAGAAFDAGLQFSENGNAYADAMTKVSLRIRAGTNPAPIILKILGNARVEQIAPHHAPSPKPICLRTASRLNRRNSSRYRSID